jgi:methionyl-tRNA formyltransferase
MRTVIIGQAAFGDAVLKRFLEQGIEVVGVSTPPDRGGREDPLKSTALANGLPWLSTRDLRQDETYQQFQAWQPELGVMAFVTDILPEKVLEEPSLGTIQYHPSLLPKHRGASAINWTVIQGETKTGLTIFWPDRGLDTGPVLLQKEVEVGPDDTVGSLYFNHLFPLGVDALAESVALVQQGQAPRLVQDESQATYEPIFKDEHANIDWSQDAQTVYNLVRGSTPAPGANTAYQGTSLQLFESKLLPGGGAGRPGEVLAVDDSGIQVALPGGVLLVERLRAAEGGKVAAAEYAREAGIKVGDQLG